MDKYDHLKRLPRRITHQLWPLFGKDAILSSRANELLLNYITTPFSEIMTQSFPDLQHTELPVIATHIVTNLAYLPRTSKKDDKTKPLCYIRGSTMTDIILGKQQFPFAKEHIYSAITSQPERIGGDTKTNLLVDQMTKDIKDLDLLIDRTDISDDVFDLHLRSSLISAGFIQHKDNQAVFTKGDISARLNQNRHKPVSLFNIYFSDTVHGTPLFKMDFGNYPSTFFANNGDIRFSSEASEIDSATMGKVFLNENNDLTVTYNKAGKYRLTRFPATAVVTEYKTRNNLAAGLVGLLREMNYYLAFPGYQYISSVENIPFRVACTTSIPESAHLVPNDGILQQITSQREEIEGRLYALYREIFRLYATNPGVGTAYMLLNDILPFTPLGSIINHKDISHIIDGFIQTPYAVELLPERHQLAYMEQVDLDRVDSLGPFRLLQSLNKRGYDVGNTLSDFFALHNPLLLIN